MSSCGRAKRGLSISAAAATRRRRLIDREVEILGPLAPFHLDKGDSAAAPRDQVDLAHGNAQPLAQNPPAVEAQPPGGAAFGAASARLGPGAFPPASFSVSARA